MVIGERSIRGLLETRAARNAGSDVQFIYLDKSGTETGGFSSIFSILANQSLGRSLRDAARQGIGAVAPGDAVAAARRVVVSRMGGGSEGERAAQLGAPSSAHVPAMSSEGSSHPPRRWAPAASACRRPRTAEECEV